ncbi:MAG TPA: hypothetical protein V6D47_11820 [Oscillatoriaceae cyanobacterium]
MARFVLSFCMVLVMSAGVSPAQASMGFRPLPRPTPTPGPNGAAYFPLPRPDSDGTTNDLVAQAVQEARTALHDYRGLREDLYFARDPRQQASIEADMEQSTRSALARIFALVANNTTTNSPKSQVLIYQTAKDALGAGNSSGDLMQRVNYNLDALRTIASQ